MTGGGGEGPNESSTGPLRRETKLWIPLIHIPDLTGSEGGRQHKRRGSWKPPTGDADIKAKLANIKGNLD